MRQHDRGELANAEPPKPRRHFGLRRALIDEHRALGDLQQRCVALADVEEGDTQPGRGRQRARSDRAGAASP